MISNGNPKKLGGKPITLPYFLSQTSLEVIQD
jgi:hypothetical protein